MLSLVFGDDSWRISDIEEVEVCYISDISGSEYMFVDHQDQNQLEKTLVASNSSQSAFPLSRTCMQSLRVNKVGKSEFVVYRHHPHGPSKISDTI